MKNFYTLSMLKRSMLRFCMLGAALVWVAGASAQPISLTMRDATIRQVIEKLQKEYGYSFSIRTSEVDVNKRISVTVKDADIRKVLETVFAGEKVAFTIDGKLISITKDVRETKAAPGKPVTVSGVVFDEQGLPVVGAAVIVKGTTQGTSSGVDGAFRLQTSAVRSRIADLVSWA